jgi:hypothetical protein
MLKSWRTHPLKSKIKEFHILFSQPWTSFCTYMYTCSFVTLILKLELRMYVCT